MKKFVNVFAASILVVAMTLTAAGQESQLLVSKKGIPILPQKGDFAIGVSATPFLDFVGNATKINNNETFSSPASWNFIDPSKMYIFGKYFLNDNTAIRAKVRIGLNSETETALSVKNGTTENEMVEDTWTHSTTNVVLAGGIEKRRGYGRLQGYYGAEAMITILGGATDTYEYGNEINKTYTTPARHDFNGNVAGGYYLTKNTTKSLLGFGVGAFVGVEYFFAPKMSVGGEFGWGIGINQSDNVTGNSEQTDEYWNGEEVQSDKVNAGGKVTSFNIDTRSTGGQIFLLFHF